MKTYLQFERPGEGRQVSASQATEKPGPDWYLAPTNYDPDALYERVDGKIRKQDLIVIESQQLEAAKAEALASVLSFANNMTRPVLAKYSDAEIQGFTERAADSSIILEAYDKGEPIQAALQRCVILNTRAVEKGWTDEEVIEKAQAILTRRAEFGAISAMVETMREEAEAAINTVASLEQLQTVLEVLREQALLKARAVGLA